MGLGVECWEKKREGWEGGGRERNIIVLFTIVILFPFKLIHLFFLANI